MKAVLLYNTDYTKDRFGITKELLNKTKLKADIKMYIDDCLIYDCRSLEFISVFSKYIKYNESTIVDNENNKIKIALLYTSEDSEEFEELCDYIKERSEQ